MPLKSPKVLFTRTSVYNQENFFPAPLSSPIEDKGLLSADDTELNGYEKTNGSCVKPIFDIDLEEKNSSKNDNADVSHDFDLDIENATSRAEGMTSSQLKVDDSSTDISHENGDGINNARKPSLPSANNSTSELQVCCFFYPIGCGSLIMGLLCNGYYN